MPEKILYKELSYKLVGCFYKVYNKLGPGHKEVGVYEPDFIIDDKIIVEIKSVLHIPKVYELQLYYYLKGSNYRLGYLANFGSNKIGIRRRIV